MGLHERNNAPFASVIWPLRFKVRFYNLYTNRETDFEINNVSHVILFEDNISTINSILLF